MSINLADEIKKAADFMNQAQTAQIQPFPNQPGSKSTQTNLQARLDELTDLLEDTLMLLKGQEDVVDGDYGIPEPNRAMQLAARIREALGQA